jgi:hypothetical protein
MAPASGLSAGSFDGISLQEPVEVLFFTPAASEVVELQLAGGQIGDDGIDPLWQLHSQASGVAAEELDGALHGLGKAQPPAGRQNGGRVSNLGTDRYDVGQGKSPWLDCLNKVLPASFGIVAD